MTPTTQARAPCRNQYEAESVFARLRQSNPGRSLSHDEIIAILDLLIHGKDEEAEKYFKGDVSWE